MVWPLQYMWVVICVSAVAIVVPWLIPAARRGILWGVIAAVTATCTWVAYENHLHSIARPGDPLIRIDLLLIVPLLALDWVSAFAAVVLTLRRERVGSAALPHA